MALEHMAMELAKAISESLAWLERLAPPRSPRFAGRLSWVVVWAWKSLGCIWSADWRALTI